jgi:hypothetical protein
MLYNTEIKFKERAYMDFNFALKLIKLRSPLTQIVMGPDIYIRSKVPEKMFEIWIKFAEIRNLDRSNLVTNLDLYPDYSTLIVFERMYGDSISYYDQHGTNKKRRRRRV